MHPVYAAGTFAGIFVCLCEFFLNPIFSYSFFLIFHVYWVRNKGKEELLLKHIFILNPNAGHGTTQKELEDKLSGTSFDWQLYTTTAAGDAVRFIREWCDSHPEPVRFYACGGDGTIHEVANAVYGYSQASMSCYPVGSGNDFVKYYGGKERFLDPVALCSAPEVSIDLIRVNDRYAINACHFGLDSCVASVMDKIRHKKNHRRKTFLPDQCALCLL